MPLTKDRNTAYQDGELMSVPMAASAKIFAGSIVVANATGYGAPGSTALNLTVLGRSEEYKDNTDGADAADMQQRLQNIRTVCQSPLLGTGSHCCQVAFALGGPSAGLAGEPQLTHSHTAETRQQQPQHQQQQQK